MITHLSPENVDAVEHHLAQMKLKIKERYSIRKGITESSDSGFETGPLGLGPGTRPITREFKKSTTATATSLNKKV